MGSLQILTKTLFKLYHQYQLVTTSVLALVGIICRFLEITQARNASILHLKLVKEKSSVETALTSKRWSCIAFEPMTHRSA